MGLSYHANSVQEFIEMFCNLREVRESLFFAEWVVGEEVVGRVWGQVGREVSKRVKCDKGAVFLRKGYQKLGYSIDKINSVLYAFFEYLVGEKLHQAKNT